MNAPGIIRDVMNLKGYSNGLLAKKMGYKTPSGVSERIRSSRISLEVFCEMMEAMGCEVIVRDTARTTVNGKGIIKEWKVDTKEMIAPDGDNNEQDE